jgi:hypothetical protein
MCKRIHAGFCRTMSASDTNAWRAKIGYGPGTRAATRETIMQEAANIYKDYPYLLKALGL